MRKDTRHVGLDVHAETIAVAVAEPDGEVGGSPASLESHFSVGTHGNPVGTSASRGLMP